MENLGLAVVNIFTVDWVTVSFNTDVYSVISAIGLNSELFSFSEKYSWGYPCTAEFGHVRIYYNPDEFSKYPRFEKANKGCCVNLSGQACRELETHSKFPSWPKLFSIMTLLDGKFTRLDLAYDDRTGVINLPRLAIDVAERNFIGHAKKSERLYSDDIDEDIQGLTVYVGSRKSDLFIRVYDKAAERGFKPSELHWVRIEIQMRRDRAEMAARAVATDPYIGNVFAGILSNYFRILQPTSDSNKSRWPTADYWEKILRDVASLKLTMPGVEYNFRKAEVHLQKQYYQFFYTYLKIYGVNAPKMFFDDIERLCENREIKEKYLAAIRDHEKIHGVVTHENAQKELDSLANFKLKEENVMLRQQLEHLRNILADLKYRDAETVSFYELFEHDPDLPFDQ